MNKNRFYQFWLYFKAGRNEIGVFYGVINTLLLMSMRFDFDVDLVWGIAYALGFILVSVVGGYFLKREVEPQNSLINPFTLDGIYSAISLQKSMICYYEGDYEGAIKLMQEAVELREKWLK